jgi:hypothetical protein
MTSSQFQMLRMLGRIDSSARVRTVLFKFPGSSNEWAEVFIDGRSKASTRRSQQQEDEFRRRFSFATSSHLKRFIILVSSTVAAKDWVFI